MEPKSKVFLMRLSDILGAQCPGCQGLSLGQGWAQSQEGTTGTLPHSWSHGDLPPLTV